MKNYRQHIKTLETGNARSMVVTSSFAGFPFLNGGFMLAEITVMLGSITHNVPVTPNFFNYLLNLQKDPTTFSDIVLGIRLAVYQFIDYFLSVTKGSTIEEKASKPENDITEKMYADDPSVLSANLFAQGLKLKKDSDYEGALLAFDQYRMFHPEDPTVYFEMADCNFAIDINDKAMAFVDRAISLDPEYGEAIGLKGCLLTMNKEYQTALYFLHIGNTLAPNTENILCGLYLVYIEYGMLKSAMTCLQQIIAVNPFEVSYLHNQAVLYECFGQLDKAIGIMKKVVGRCPDEIKYTEYLNDLEQTQGEKVNSFYVGMNN